MVTARAARPKRASEAAVRRRARLQEASRSDILESAARAFSRRGYRAATMTQIAAEAGYTAASLYTYFESKEAIFEAMLDQMMSEFGQTLTERGVGTDLEARLIDLLERQFAIAERKRSFMLFFMRFSTGLEALPERLVARGVEADEERFMEETERWLQKNARRGELGRATAEEVTMLLHAIVHSQIRRWLREEPPPALVPRAAETVRTLLYGIRGRGAAP